MTILYSFVDSQLGPVFIAENRIGLIRVVWGQKGRTDLEAYARRWFPGEPIMASTLEAGAQIEEYLDGQRRMFDLTLDMRGTPFQLEVWQALRNIPYGQTRSYGQVAREIGRPGAARAVGAACGANPIPLVVPCHRVIGSQGGLGGFATGLADKKWLLELEGDRTDSQRPIQA